MLDALQTLTGYLQTIFTWLWRFLIDLAKDHPWAAAATGFAVARMFGTVVETGSRGVLFSFGNVKAELEPGFHWLAPIVHHVRKVRIRSASLDLPLQRITTRDGLVYDVDSNVVYHIADAKKSVVQIDDVEKGCRTVIPLVIAEILREQENHQLADRSRLAGELTARVQTRVACWGIVVEHAGLQSIAPTRETLRITQLKLRCDEQMRLYWAMRERGLSSDNALSLMGAQSRLLEKSVVRRRGYRRRLAASHRFAALVRPKDPEFKVGDHVWANWWELGNYYPGVVTALDTEHLNIKYDDGVDEIVQRRNIRRDKPTK